MSDLSQKFESFQQQSATQHAALMAALGLLGNKLDSIITAVTPAPATGPTLAEVVEAIEALHGTAALQLAQDTAQTTALADIHTDTMSMDGKLLVMRNTLTDVHTDTMSMDGKLLVMRNTLTAILEHLSAQGDSAIIAAIKAALGTPTGDASSTVLGLLASLQYSNAGIYSSIGILGTGGNTVLKLLEKSADCGCGGAGGADSRDCSQAFTSSGMWLAWYGLVGYESFMVATFSGTLPAGIQYSTLFGLTEDGTELYNADWAGWRVLVTSDEAQYSDQALSGQRYPTNVWRDLPSGPASYSWSVSDKGNIKVSLCPPGVEIIPISGGGVGSAPVTECVTSAGVAFDRPSPWAWGANFVTWNEGTSEIGNFLATEGNKIFLYGDLGGWEVTSLSGGAAIFNDVNSGGAHLGHATPGNPITLPGGTQYIFADIGTGSSVTLRVCPLPINTT